MKNGNVCISLGSKMEFSVRNSEGTIAKMGEKIHNVGCPLEISISIDSVAPLRAVIIKNGLLFNSAIVHTENEIKFTDHHPAGGYYHVGFHNALENPLYPEPEW